MWGWMDRWNTNDEWFWVIIILVVVLIGLVIWLLTRSTRSSDVIHRRDTPRNDPLEIARERLARGEITPEQYEAIKRTLTL